MKIVITLGGNALLRRGQAMTAANQTDNVRKACQALKEVAAHHQLVLSHGNGPQVGLLALQNEAFADHVEPYPFDILGAESQAMVGYLFAQELRNALPKNDVACVITQSVVSADDPAFKNPTKFIGPVYDKETAEKLAAEKGWVVREDGQYYRRVVPSPRPTRIVEIESVRRLVDAGVMVISGGGGGVPVLADEEGRLTGVEAVIDKDYCCSILATELNADYLVIATDVPGVFVNWGTPEQKQIRRASPDHLRALGFAAGSMGPKVTAACEFAEKTGHSAAIGALEDIKDIVDGRAGTLISTDCKEVEYY